MTYAKGTQVSAERSREEIDRLLARYGADAFMYGWEGGRAVLAFHMKGRHIKFIVPMRDKGERRWSRHLRVRGRVPRQHRDAGRPHGLRAHQARDRARLRLRQDATAAAGAGGVRVASDSCASCKDSLSPRFSGATMVNVFFTRRDDRLTTGGATS